MFTSHATVAVRRALVAGFGREDENSPTPTEWEDKFRDELEYEGLPPKLTAALADSGVQYGCDVITRLRRGRLMQQEPKIYKECCEDWELDAHVAAGEEALRRLAIVARKRMRGRNDLQDQLDEELRECGLKWTGDLPGQGYQPHGASTTRAVPKGVALAALAEKADLHNEDELVELCERVEASFFQATDEGRHEAAGLAGEFLDGVIFGVARRFDGQLPVGRMDQARDTLRSKRIFDRWQEERFNCLYRAVREVPHDARSREDASLDVAAALVAAEFVLRRYITWKSGRRM
jgi:hypothetical protein